MCACELRADRVDCHVDMVDARPGVRYGCGDCRAAAGVILVEEEMDAVWELAERVDRQDMVDRDVVDPAARYRPSRQFVKEGHELFVSRVRACDGRTGTIQALTLARQAFHQAANDTIAATHDKECVGVIGSSQGAEPRVIRRESDDLAHLTNRGGLSGLGMRLDAYVMVSGVWCMASTLSEHKARPQMHPFRMDLNRSRQHSTHHGARLVSDIRFVVNTCLASTRAIAATIEQALDIVIQLSVPQSLSSTSQNGCIQGPSDWFAFPHSMLSLPAMRGSTSLE
ncbi:hypothetical protein BKA63DRAFT_578271 [Paraphoma chrysanthemicola]|nr:hypothetical protein BKA63DRAFT_578271 [Paraphoma chrysanthemicola]